MSNRITALASSQTLPDQAGDSGWQAPEDRSQATLSDLGNIEYAEDLVRPQQMITIAAEEGTGKSMAFPGELGIRLAVAGGSFAQTWEIRDRGPVVYLSEMSPDEDYRREEMILAELGITRGDLVGRYFRQGMNAVMHGRPVLDSHEWIERFIEWSRVIEPIALFIDTATMATDAEPFGREMRQVVRNLRLLQEANPKLAVLPIVHFKKPPGREGLRRGISSVMGEWGRPSDVVVLLQSDSLTQVRVSTHKRVRNQRVLLLTKRNGLLVDPIDLTEARPPTQKVSDEGVLAAIRANPGITLRGLAAEIGVAPTTAGAYVDRLVKLEHAVVREGPANSKLVYASDNAHEQLVLVEEAVG